jgi:hypothetical protein
LAGGWTLGLVSDPGASSPNIWLVSFNYAFARQENMDCRKSPEPNTLAQGAIHLVALWFHR